MGSLSRHAAVSALALLMTAAAARSAWPQLPAVPETTVPAAAQTPVLDGNLEDAAWSSAARIENFSVLGVPDKAVPGLTALLTADRDWLYIGLIIPHPSPQSIRPRIYRHDGPVHADDSVEIFLDPGTDGAVYFHFLLNAGNTSAEQKCDSRGGRDRLWNIPWKSAVRTTASGWQAEIAIPLFILTSFGEMQNLRMNLAVNSFIPVVDPSHVEVGQQRVHALWSPVYASFHEHNRFGRVHGLEKAAPRNTFLPGFQDVRVGTYSWKEGGFHYDVTVTLQAFTPVAGRVRLSLTDRPVSGEGRTVVQEAAVPGMQRTSLALSMPVASLVDRTAVVALADAETGEMIQTRVIEDMGSLSLMSVYLDRTYYTTEKQAQAICRLGIPASTLAECVLTIRNQAGAVLGRSTKVSAETRVGLPLTEIPEGVHTLEAVLEDRDGRPMVRKTALLVKRAPKPGLEWKVDRENLVFLRNGEPVFPFGLVTSGEKNFRQAAEASCNAVLFWGFRTDPKKALDPLDAAARHGLNLFLPAETFASGPLTHLKGQFMSKPLEEGSRGFLEAYRKEEERILEGVNTAREHPSLAGYYLFDEPFPFQVAAGRELYRRLNESDGYHPAVTLYSSELPRDLTTTDWYDVLGNDPYWIPEGDGIRGSMNYVSLITWRTRQQAEATRQPVFIVPVGELWSGMHKRVILPREQKCQTYLAIIHGARALFYFHYPFASQGSYDAIADLGREMKVIGPAAVTPDIPQTVAYRPVAFDPEKMQFPEVQVYLKRNPSGGYLLLAANSRPYPVDVRFSVSLLGRSGSVKRLFENSAHPVRNGSFSDRIEPYGTRAYSFAGSQPSGTVEISVDADGQPGQAVTAYTEPALPRSGRKDRRNIVANPSFEEATVPRWPDYYRYHDFSGSETRIGAPGARFEQDTSTAYHGAASLRLTARLKGRNVFGQEVNVRNWLSWWPGATWYLSPQVDRPTRFVLSAYLKADRPGIRAVFHPGVDGKEVNPKEPEKAGFALTTEWQRYFETGILRPPVDPYQMFGIRACGEGTVWIDAVQFEIGETPTEFEP